MKYDYRDAPEDLVAKARAIAQLCEQHGTTLPAAAVRFAFTHPAVANVTLGIGSADHVRRNADLLSTTFPHELRTALLDAGLIREDVATT